MLTYITIGVTLYLVAKILRAPSGADAAGYLLVSGLIPLPVYMVGHSAQASVFAIDICLFGFLWAHGRPALRGVTKHRALFAGAGALFGLSILATFSGIFNFVIDPSPLKFYAYTIIKFWEYAVLAAALIANKPSGEQLRKISGILITGILIYECLHVLHITGLVPMSGEAYFGPDVANIDTMRAAPFTDPTGWFLTSYRIVVGGTASISAMFSLMVFEAYHGTIKKMAAVALLLSVFSVVATSSRSDIAGLPIAAVVFVLFSPRRRWKTYVGALAVIALIYVLWLTVSLSPSREKTELTRISAFWNPQVRAAGSYADRSHDRTSMMRYLPEHPKDLLIGVGPGNFHWYQYHGITRNFSGHNSYLNWTGDFGIGGLFLLIAWCFSICWYARGKIRSQHPLSKIAARTCLAVVVDRMVAAWGAESLFGTQGMGYYSLYFVGVVYLLAIVALDSERSGHGVQSRHQPTSTEQEVVASVSMA